MRNEAVIGGHYGDRNLGDQAIAAVITEALLACGHRRVCHLALRRPGGQPLPRGEATALDLTRLAGWVGLFRALRRCRTFVIGGGGIIQDATSLGNLLVHFGATVCGRVSGGRVVLAGVGIGPLKRPVSRWLASAIVRMADGILVRDRGSWSFCSQVLGRTADVRLAPDLAFALLPRSVVHAAASFQAARPAADAGRVLLSLRPPVGDRSRRMLPGERYVNNMTRLAQAVVAVAGRHGLSVAFLAMHPVQDMQLWERVRRGCGDLEAVAAVVGDSPWDVLDAMSQGDIVVGARLHCLILATMRGAVPVPIGYDPKVVAFADQMGLPGVCAVSGDGEVDLAELEAMVDNAIRTRHESGMLMLRRAEECGTLAARELRALLDEA